MSDHNHDDDDDEHRRVAGILFSGLLGGDEDIEERRHARDRHAAERDDLKNRMFAALRSMNAEQVFMVRHMLVSGMRNKKALSFFDGICNAILLVEHGVDPDTGKTPEQILLEHPGHDVSSRD